MNNVAEPARPLVVAFGVFPPPVTGMSLCTQRVVDHLAPSCRVISLDVSTKAAKISWRFRIGKLLRTGGALLRLALDPRLRGATLYMPLNAAGAMSYNLAAAALGRLRRWRIVVHHHAYVYLNQTDRRVRWIDRLMGSRGLHLPLCDDMRRKLIERYQIVAPCAYLPSTITILDAQAPTVGAKTGRHPGTTIRLGHISNLSKSKGALLAIDVLARLLAQGRKAQLIMAGPATEPEVEAAIAAAEGRFGAAFEYRGPVYGDAKAKFYDEIDVLLFPSLYRAEAQPIVLSEAFARGKPALSFGISCIPTLVGVPGWYTSPQTDFTEFAAGIVGDWQDDPASYAAAQEVARRRTSELLDAARLSLQNLSAWMHSDAAKGFVLDSRAPQTLQDGEATPTVETL